MFSYEVLAEIAVIFALKMETTYKKMFFDKMRVKFLSELQYLKDDTLYKILWSLFKADAINIHAQSTDWEAVKEVLVKKSKDISPQVMADILVLATKEEQEAKAEGDGSLDNDLFT